MDTEACCAFVRDVLTGKLKQAIPDRRPPVTPNRSPVETHQLADALQRQCDCLSRTNHLKLSRQSDKPVKVRPVRLSADCLPCSIERIRSAYGITGNAPGDASNFSACKRSLLSKLGD